MSNILSRIQYIANNENISISAIERKIGTSKGVLTKAIAKNTDIQAKWLQSIAENFPQYSTHWLITGEGDALKQIKEETIRVVSPEVNIRSTETEIRIPLVNQWAVAGFGNSNFSIQAQDVKEYYVVPKFKYSRVDFMIEIYGSSMTPTYNSGDVIACTILKNKNYIQWNRAHIIATEEQGILCKRIMPSDKDGYITAISDNQEYPPFDIPCSEVTGIALIVGVIRAD